MKVAVIGFVAVLLSAGPVLRGQTQPPPTPAPPAQATEAPAAAENVTSLEAHLAKQKKTLNDWANLSRYREANAGLEAPAASEDRVVFMGDSITDGWGRTHGKFFPGKPYVNRGISGQTTPQMLVRFRPDVINLKPKAVVILAGTNDLSSNTGPETLEEIEGNIESMAQLAEVNGIKVILASLTPVCDYIKPQTGRRPPQQIVALNDWIQSYCGAHNCTYLDYYSAMLDDNKMLKKELTFDGLHPNDAGYEVMGPLASAAIDKALGTTASAAKQ